MRRHPSLTIEAERELITRAKGGDQKAREELLDRNMGAVNAIARLYTSPSILHEDMVSEGIIGVLEAIDRFDFAYDCRFITYVKWRIRKNITTAALNRLTNDRDRHVYYNIGKATQRLFERGIESSDVALAEELGVSVENVEAFFASKPTQLFDDFPVADPLPNADEMLTNHATMFDIKNAIGQLEEKRQYVLHRYFYRDESFEKIAKRMKISRSRVQQLYNEGVARVRKRVGA